MSISKRAESWLAEKGPPIFSKMGRAYGDQYDAETNPDGYISLAFAENAMSLPLVAKRFGNTAPCEPHELMYNQFGGSMPIRKTIAKFLENHITRTPVFADQIVCLTGAACVINGLIQTLCDPGEAAMVTGPGYGRLDIEIGSRTGVEIRVAHLDQAEGEDINPVVTVQALQDAYNLAKQDGIDVRAVLIISPNNPTGEVLAPSTIRDIVSWCRQNQVHAIFDELYALSVYDEKHKFCSVAQVLDGNLGDDVHIIWSMSKDFCLSGIRFGVLHSQNISVIKACANKVAFFSPTSRQSQKAVSEILSDEAWVKSFVAENHVRLKQGFECCAKALDEIGIPYFTPAAGFFVWVDMRKFMQEETEEEELALWERIFDARVLINPGSDSFGRRYGFFRICFSTVTLDKLEVAMERLRSLFQESV